MNVIRRTSMSPLALVAVLATLTTAGVVAATAPALAATPPTFTVTPAATVGLGAGQSGHPARQVVLHAANVASSDTVTLAFPSWSGLFVSVVSKAAVDATHTDITAAISTSSSSTAGSQPDLTLTDTTTSSSGTKQFTVVAAPTLTSLSPVHVLRGTTATESITGTGLQTGVALSAPAGSGVTFGAVTLSGGSTTTGSASVTIAPNAPSGAVAVTATNPDAGWSTLAGALSVDTFAVTDVTPATVTNATGNTALALTVTGTGIPSGNTTLRLTPTFAVSGQDPIVASPTGIAANGSSWQGNVNLASAAPGSYQLQLLNGSEVGTLTSKSFTVTSAGTPTVTSVTPSSLGQGADTTITIVGTNFAHGATVTFSKAGFTRTGPVVFDSAAQLRVPIHVASNAATGSANATNVTVTNTGGSAGMRTAAITVTAGPAITSLSPTSLGQGAATTLTINGSGFSTSGTKATVTFGTGVVATGSATVTAGQIKIPVKVDSKAPVSVSVKVQNPDLGSAQTTLAVTAMTFTAVSPHYVASNYSGNLVLTGTDFRTGATVTFPNGAGVAVQSGKGAAVTNSGTTLTVPVTVDRSTAATVDVTVTNTGTDFGVVTCTGCLGVAVAPSAPAHAQATKSGSAASLSWDAVLPPADGGAPITGYTVSVTSPANSGIATQSLPSTSTTANFSGLDPALDYTFAIVVTNAANLSSSPASAGTSRRARLTLGVSVSRITAGQSLRVHGVLRDHAGAPISGAGVSVHRRADSGVSRTIAAVTTDSAGRWSVLTRPHHNQTYDADFAGDGVNLAATAPGRRVVVSPRISIEAPVNSVTGSPIVVRGHVSPSKSGQSVRLVALDAAGRLHRLGRVFLDGRSSYHFHAALGAGHWRLRVRIGHSGGNASGRSPYLRVVRNRP